MVAINSNSIPKRRHFWITDSALSNWREKVKNFPPMENELLVKAIDDIVNKAIDGDYWEEIEDGDEHARLVHLNLDSSPYFALVKKSSNPANGDFAVVTIMTQAQVEKKRQTQWGKASGSSESRKPLETTRSSEPRIPTLIRQPVGGEKPSSYLISYMPFKETDPSKRVHEEYSKAEEVENRLDEVKIIPGTLRVYKQLALGYRIIEE